MKQSDFASRLSQALEARGMKAADLSKKNEGCRRDYKLLYKWAL